ncbi:MAG TPA: prolyl oligopeptidase family serine peptidase [Steroidobacteraceae bacterium]
MKVQKSVRRSFVIGLCAGVSALCACSGASDSAAPAARLTYPVAPRSDHVDDYHGTKVPDPYRVFEDLNAPETKRFVAEQNALSQPFLEGIPARERIKARMTELWNYERYEVPVKAGSRYFYLRNDGKQNQSVLYVADALDAPPRALIDPNTMSEDATVALAEFVPSPDGKLVAYSISDGGTDWRIWRFRNVETGEDLPDTLRHIKFREPQWTADSRAVYYARYPQTPSGAGDDSKQMSVYRHRIGDPVEKDPHIYSITDHPTRYPYPYVSDDGRYLVHYVYDGRQSTGIHYQRLDERGEVVGPVVKLIDTFDAEYQFLDVIDDVMYLRTNAGAPNGRVIAIDLKSKDKAWRDVVPEQQYAIVGASIVGRKIFLVYSRDAYAVARASNLDGSEPTEIELPGLGEVSGFIGSTKDFETFFSYTDFLTPKAIYRYDIRSKRAEPFRVPKIAADTSRFVTEQVFYTSKDGTRVPMFITRKRDFVKDGSAPLLLLGYGGFNIAQQPEFSVPNLVWLEMGGVYAVANIRGGGEYGEAWHSAGTKLNKQNVFDDFIAAGEWLIEQKYTSTPKFAIRGRSNGGLLVGAVLTQRPDLFGAALPAVGVLDMLRYHTASANARQWSTDYGLSENLEEFNAQYAYSPVHNVKPGTCYPPTLVTTAEYDDRVVPWHSYKFTAALQAAQSCSNPILLRVETRAGHGAGKPVWMQIEDFADQWAFLVHALKME